MDMEKRVHVHIIIPTKTVPLLLGKQGSNIKRLAHRSAVYLTIRPPESSPHVDDRVLVVTGGLKNIHNAIRDVISDIQSGTKCNMIDTEAEVLPGKSILQIPSSFATKLMASKAKELQEIAKQSGARFQLTPVEDMALGSTIRRLFITGSDVSCRTAVARVLQKLHEFNQLPLDNRQEEMTLKMMVPQEAMQYLTIPTIQHIMMSQGVVIKHFPIDELKESIVTISGTLTKVFKAQTEIMRVLDSYNILMLFTHTKKQLSPTNARRVEFERHLPNEGRHVEYERLPPSRWNMAPNPREVVREYNDEFRQPRPKQPHDFPQNRSQSNDIRTPRDGRSNSDDRSFMGQKQPTHENVGEANQSKPHSTTEPLRTPNGGKVARPSDPRRKVMSVSSNAGDSMSPRDDMRRSKPVDPRRQVVAQTQDISSLKPTDPHTSQLGVSTDGSVSQKPIDPRFHPQLHRDGPVEKPSDPRARPRPASNTNENTIIERATERTSPESTLPATLSTPTTQQRDLQTSTVKHVDPRARVQSLLNQDSPAGKPVDPRVKPSLLTTSNATDSQTLQTSPSNPTGPANHGKLNRQSLTDSSDSSAPVTKPVDPRKRSIPQVAFTNTASYQSDSRKPEVNGQTSRSAADKNTIIPQTSSSPPIPHSTQPANTSINRLDTNATINANAPLMTKISLSKDNDQSPRNAKSLLNIGSPKSSGKNSNGLKTGHHEASNHAMDEYDADPNDSPVVILGTKPRARKLLPTIDLTIDSDSDTVSPQNLDNGRIKKEPNDLTQVQQVGDVAKSSSSVKYVGSMENQRSSHENHMNAMPTVSQNGVTRPISSSIPLDVTDSPSSPITQVSKNVHQPADPRRRSKTNEEGPGNTAKQNLSSQNKQLDTKGQIILPKTKQQQVEVKVTAKDTSSAVVDTNVDYQLKIKEFYINHRPEKLHLLDTLLLTYKGREQELFNMLSTIESKSRQKISTSQSQIGANPSTSTSSKLQSATASASLVNPISTTTNPAPTHYIASDVPSSQKPHVSPPSSANQTPIDYRAKVIAHYQQYSPEKLGSVDSILLKYKGKEEELLKSLMLVESAFSKKVPIKSPVNLTQYDQSRKEARDAMPTLSVFPPSKSNPVNSKKSNLPTSTPEQDASKTDYRAKVIEHYTKFSPKRLKDIDSIMLKHKGKEEELLKTLKYVEVCHLAAPKIAAAAAAITQRSLGFAPSNNVVAPTGDDAKESATKPQTTTFDIESIPPTKKATGIMSPVLVDYHAKVIEHYKKYCPQKLCEVDAIMEEYKGNEKNLLIELKHLLSYHRGATPALSKAKKTSTLATEVSSINDEVDTTSYGGDKYANIRTEQTRSKSTPSNSAVSNSYGGEIYSKERHSPTHASPESCPRTSVNINVFKAKDTCGAELETSQAFGSTVYKAATAPHNNGMATSATTLASNESSEVQNQVEKSSDRNESVTKNSDDVSNSILHSPTVTRDFASHFLSRSKVVEPINQEEYIPAQPSSRSLEAPTIISSNEKPKDDQMESHSTHQIHSELEVNKRHKSDSIGSHKPLQAKIEDSTPSIADVLQNPSLNIQVSDKPDTTKPDEYHIREINDFPLDKQPAMKTFIDEAKESINVAPGVKNRTLKSPIVEAPGVPQPRVSYSSDDDAHTPSGLSYQNQSFSHSDSSSHQIGTLVPMDWSSNTTTSDQTLSRYPARNSSYNLSPRDRKRQHEYDIREENKRRVLAMRPGEMMLHEQQAEIETQVEIRVSGAIAQQVVGMGGLGLVEVGSLYMSPN
ncbi:hypothetical protein AC1031_013045 [Aphanomyces cochlioides]|nr:hypothetical protein AC1031_013045 [Aphanomyces cochlioides]